MLCATIALTVGAGPALASGGPGGGGGGGGGGTDIRLITTGNCGDQMRLRVRNTGDTIELDITIPSADPSEVWSLAATQQDYGAGTGGRSGNPVTLSPGVLPPLAYNLAEGGFATAGTVANTDNLTHGISYTATRTSPTTVTCTNKGFWTNPSGTGSGPASQNPTGRPDSPPAFTGESEVDVGSNDALLLMDQEMLDSGLGIPANNRFTVKVDGVARSTTAVRIANDSPPDLAVLDLSFDGAAITSGQAVTVQYVRPITSGSASLRDLESLQTASFGPSTLTVV
jgi:hypothetical protein